MSCNCEHCHKGDIEEKSGKAKKILYVLSIILFIISFFIENNIAKIILYAATVAFCGYEVIISGLKNIIKLNFEEDTLMTIAVIAAFILGEFPESCFVLLLFGLGEFIEEVAVRNSKKHIENVVSMKQENSNLLQEDGSITIVETKDVKVGDIIVIKPGESVPLDGTVIYGTTTLDTSTITGESTPVVVEKNAQVFSGSINLTSIIHLKVQKDINNSMVSQIENLVENATQNKGKTEKFITKFSKVYTPIVMILALLFAINIPAFGILEIKEAINRSLIFLVAACPCSIVISIPLAFFSCIGATSKKGMLIKGTKHIQNLAKTKIIAFDKTGTLTTGKMELDNVETLGKMGKEEILQYIASLENLSNHPIAATFKNITNKQMEVSDFQEIAGCGLYGIINEQQILFGNKKLLEKYKIENVEKLNNSKTYFVVNKQLEGAIQFKEELRSNKEILNNFKKIGIEKLVMLTGDNSKNAEKIAKEYKIDEIHAELLPNEKQQIITKLKQEGKTIFLGDGINDAPVIAEADFGIAMEAGSQLASTSADAILMNNNIAILEPVIKTAKKTMNIVIANIVFSLGIKAIVLTLGAFGIAPIWSAVLADTGVTLLTIINALRIMK